jgi:hypothetical protein
MPPNNSKEDVGSVLIPGQVLTQNLDFEFRYDVIDSNGDYWSYRVNESIPVTIQSPKQPAETMTTFGTVFVSVTFRIGICYCCAQSENSQLQKESSETSESLMLFRKRNACATGALPSRGPFHQGNYRLS